MDRSYERESEKRVQSFGRETWREDTTSMT
jgi:hypothetical protein